MTAKQIGFLIVCALGLGLYLVIRYGGDYVQGLVSF